MKARNGLLVLLILSLIAFNLRAQPATTGAILPDPSVDLRGYGKVEASITPQRSEFACESDAKADILLGKLLADLFWDAGQDHVIKTVKVGDKDVVVHEWQPYGVVIAGRQKNRVFVIGGKDEQAVIDLAGKEPLLTSGDAVFTPANPYPKYLDFYDLRAVSCYTLGLHFENKFRYQDRAAFVQQFFKGGLFGTDGDFFFGSTPAEGVYAGMALVDTDIHLAEKNDQMYSMAISTGQWPGWAQNKWPSYIDRSSPIHDVGSDPYLWCPPESLGMSGQERRQTSLAFLRDMMNRYKDSPAMGGWQLYDGDYVCETCFSKGYQAHFGYTPVGLEAYRRWLRDVRGLSLKSLGERWYGDTNHFKDWSEVIPPDPDEFFGNFNADCLPIRDAWFWKKAGPDEIERPADDAPGWTPVPKSPSEQVMALPTGPSFWRSSFDATDWLRKNAGKEAYLVFNVRNDGWRKTNVWLNDTSLGVFQSKSNPFFGPFALKITTLLNSGVNKICLQVTGGGNPIGPVFLTTTLPQAYPYFGKLKNARFLDAMQWRLSELNFKAVDAMAYARSIDPNHPLVMCATSEEVKDAQGDALRQYGGSMQDTGYESSYRPFNSRLGYADGFYGSCEQAGVPYSSTGLKDPETYAVTMSRRLAWTLFNGEGMYVEWRDPYCYYEFEKTTGWFTKNKRGYDLIGKYLPEKPEIAIFHSSLSALLGYEFHEADWDLGRGELHASHYDNVCVTESMLAQGLADDYPVLFDTDSMFMEQSTIDAIHKYVEKGGTFIALQNTGRHSLLEPDTWPISQLTGFKVLSLAKKGKIRFADNLPIFKGWEGKEFEGEGSALDWKDTQSAKDVSVGLAPAASDTIALAKWDDGSIAVGLHKIGKGQVIILGSTFWRNGRDLGGKGMWRTDNVERTFLERLFTDLGIQRTADASTPNIYARKVITKNGLQEWLVAMNTIGVDTTTDLGFATATQPDAVWDVMDNTPVAFTYADGWVHIKDVTLTSYGTRIFGVKRGLLSEGVDFWWKEKTKFWTRRTAVAPLADTAPKATHNPSTISFKSWKFFPDRDGSIGKATDWLQPSFDDAAWRPADNAPWNFQFDDLKDYGGVGLYRSLPFAIPANWKGRRITVNADGLIGSCWTMLELYVNGEKIDEFLHPLVKIDITDHLKKDGNVVCIKLVGRSPLGDYPLSGLVACAFWIQPEITLEPSLSLLGDWQAIQGDWTTSETVSIPGVDHKLTDDGHLKAGLNPVKANHLVRDLEVPSAWKGRNVYLHLIAPQMNTQVPPAVGLTGGMLIINGQARLLDQRPNIPLDQMINLTPDIKFGQTNRIELWTRNTCKGSMTEDNIVINDMAIGCESQ